jgi:EmrB/QacA subfamily drug resistance transporter
MLVGVVLLDLGVPMRKWLPLVAICLGTFMLLIDVTIVNVALPSMAASLHTSFSSLQWVIDGYALALAALLLGIGSVADLVGLRQSYIVGLLLFAGSSLVCGLAPNADLLIGARVVQGVGGAAMFATTGALISASYDGRDRGVAYGWWGAVSGAAAAVGPIIGGGLVEGLSWRWIFFVNLPLCAIAVVMTLRFLRADQPGSGRRPDVSGTLAFTAAAGCLTYALIRANEHGWATTATYVLMAAAAVALAGFLVVESRSDHAMLDLELFGNRSFVGTIVAALLINFAAFAALTYSSIWLQTVIGLSPLQAGLTGLPLAATAFVVSGGIGRFVHGKPGPAISLGMFLVGIGSLLVTVFVHNGSSWPALVPGLVVIGFGVGLGMPVLTSSAMAAVTPQRFGMAAGAVNTARQLGYAIGIAVLGSVFSHRALVSLHSDPDAPRLARGLAGGQAPALLGRAGSGRVALDTALHHASISGIDGAFLVAGIGGVVAGLLAFVLIRPSAPAAGPTAGDAGVSSADDWQPEPASTG